MKTATEQTIFREYISKEQREADEKNNIVRREYLVEILRGFFYLVGEELAPLRAMLPGERLIMFDKRGVNECFLSGSIRLIKPTLGAGEFIVKRTSRIVVDGKYVTLHFADILRLNEAEALDLVTRGICEAIDPEMFKL